MAQRECEHEDWDVAREGETKVGCNFNDDGDISFDIVCLSCGLVGTAQIEASTLARQYDTRWWPENTEDAERVQLGDECTTTS